MKIFLSHQKLDTQLAASIASRLKTVHQIDVYLDAIDPHTDGAIEALGDHIREQMGKCHQLLAVISPATSSSQWVPWEIGVATEKDFPLATYSGSNAVPPEFIRKWPYLRNDADLDAYALASKASDAVYQRNKTVINEELARTRSTRDYYIRVRSALKQ